MESNGKALSCAEFVTTADRPPQRISLDEELYGEGACLYGCVWSGEERSEFERAWMDKDVKKNPGGFRWDVLSLTICDDGGNLLFLEQDREGVMSKNAGTLEMLFETCCTLNGLGKKDVEELEKNSESGQ